jgi:hypothetical protein
MLWWCEAALANTNSCTVGCIVVKMLAIMLEPSVLVLPSLLLLGASILVMSFNSAFVNVS